MFGCFRECFFLFQDFQGLQDGLVRLVQILQVLFHVEHVVNDVSVQVAVKVFLGLVHQDVASLQSLAFGKSGKLFQNVLSLQILQQVVRIVIFLQFGTVLVGVLETELDGQTTVNGHPEIRCHADGILRHENVGHDTSATIYRSADGGIIDVAFVLLDAVLREEFAMLTAKRSNQSILKEISPGISLE